MVRRNPVSEAFRQMEEVRERRDEPPFWEGPPEEHSLNLLRDIGLAVLLTLLTSAIGIAWIIRGLGAG